LKGAVVGVSAPGSANHFFVNYLVRKHGIAAGDVSIQGIGLGDTSMSAVEKSKVDAAVMLEPALSLLEKRTGPLTALSDTRTEQGIRDTFGADSYAATVLYARADWISGHRET